MKKPIIAVDADDTLFDENNAIRLFHNHKYGTSHTEEDYLVPGEFGAFWKHLWNTDEPETIRRHAEFTEYKLVHNLPPLEQALGVLQNLKTRYELVVVTARDKRSTLMTHDSLEAHYPDIFSDVLFAPTWQDKSEVSKATMCNYIGAAYLIDDAFHHCQLAAEIGVTALLFGNYGWNRYPELTANIIRVKDWAAVREYFDGRG